MASFEPINDLIQNLDITVKNLLAHDGKRLRVSGVSTLYVEVKETDVKNRVEFLHLLEEFLLHTINPVFNKPKHLLTTEDKTVERSIRSKIFSTMDILVENLTGVNKKDWRTKDWLGLNESSDVHTERLYNELLFRAKSLYSINTSLFAVIFNTGFIDKLSSLYHSIIVNGGHGKESLPPLLDITYSFEIPSTAIENTIIVNHKTQYSPAIEAELTEILKTRI